VLQGWDDNELSNWINDALINIQQNDNRGVNFQYKKYPQESIYGREQVEQIKNIQKQACIQADGKVGMKTIIFMNSLIDNSVPRLQDVFVKQDGSE